MSEYGLVSIISPCYNCSEYVASTIRSVLSQTYSDWEMIIVDDCSTDNSREEIERFDDPRIRCHCLEKNSGAAVARNTALRLARGRWIAFLDCDDLWDNTKLEEQLRMMTQTGCFFSYTRYRETDSSGRVTAGCISGPRRITYTGMLAYCWPGCLTVMYDADKVGLLQIPPLKRNNDYALWILTSRKADCHLLDRTLATYRRHSGSVSNVTYRELIRWHYRLFRDLIGKGKAQSMVLTMGNLVFGVYKKLVYRK